MTRESFAVWWASFRAERDAGKEEEEPRLTGACSRRARVPMCPLTPAFGPRCRSATVRAPRRGGAGRRSSCRCVFVGCAAIVLAGPNADPCDLPAACLDQLRLQRRLPRPQHKPRRLVRVLAAVAMVWVRVRAVASPVPEVAAPRLPHQRLVPQRRLLCGTSPCFWKGQVTWTTLMTWRDLTSATDVARARSQARSTALLLGYCARTVEYLCLVALVAKRTAGTFRVVCGTTSTVYAM